MRTTPTLAHQKLLELLRLTPQAHLREGYVMALRNAVDDYVWAILHEVDRRLTPTAANRPPINRRLRPPQPLSRLLPSTGGSARPRVLIQTSSKLSPADI